MEMFTIKMLQIFDALLVDKKLLTFIGRLLDPKHINPATQQPIVAEVSRYFADVLLKFLIEERLDLLKVSCVPRLISISFIASQLCASSPMLSCSNKA